MQRNREEKRKKRKAIAVKEKGKTLRRTEGKRKEKYRKYM